MTTSLNSVSALPPNLVAARPDHALTRAPAQKARADGVEPGAVARSAAAPVPADWAAGSAITVKAPEGTDPHLWSILTGEERAFFARTVTSGPLTYTKVMMPDRVAPPTRPSIRGGRVDIRV